MAMEAQLTISGYVGSAVEFRPTRNNTPRATFRIGCTPRVQRQGGWTDGPTVWMTIVCWRSLAEHAAASINKGDPVVVQGRLRNQVWSDANGETHERLAVDATSVGHDLSRGRSTFHRVQRVDPPDDLDRETGEMITKVEQEDLDEPIEDSRLPAGTSG